MITINPSILSANFSNLSDDIKSIEKSKTNMIHLDVMDGIFVPNISFGSPIIESLRNITNMQFDVHLMIVDPIRYIKNFALAGADVISFHYEACSNHIDVISEIKKYGKKAAIAINPNTSVESIYKYLEYIDMVLIMTVYPGFSGQKFISDCLNKVEKLYSYVKKNNLKIDIETDGGINSNTIIDCAKSGSNIMVSGSTIFNSNDIIYKINELTDIAENNYRG